MGVRISHGSSASLYIYIYFGKILDCKRCIYVYAGINFDLIYFLINIAVYEMGNDLKCCRYSQPSGIML